ncbi:MAG: SpoIIE family protein phosphatase [Clostridia bacterium]|nr:SpoIIE family protein phosphatase [Clostridia bacterium]
MSRGQPSPAKPARSGRPARAAWLPLALRTAAFVVAGLLFGRASLFGALSPFGPALVAAFDWAWGLGPAVLGLAGAAFASGLARGWGASLACALLSAAALAYPRTRGAAPRGSLFWGLSLAAAGIVLGAPFASGGDAGSAWAATVVQAALVPVLAAILAPFLEEFDLRGEAGREPGGRSAAGRPDPLAASLGLAVGAAVAVAGLGRLGLGPFELRAALAAFLTLLSGSRRGSGAGAAVGTALGVASLLFGAGGAATAAAWGFGGLLAGAFAPWGRWAAACGFAMGAGLAALPTPLGELPDPAAALGMLAGTVAFALLPPRAAAALAVPRAGPADGRPAVVRDGEGAPQDERPRAPGRAGERGPGPEGGARSGPGGPNLKVLQGGLRAAGAHPGREGAAFGARPSGGARPAAKPRGVAGDGAQAEPIAPARFAQALRKLAEACEPGPEERGDARRRRPREGEPPLSPAEEGTLRALAEAVRDEVCPGCPAWTACWEGPQARTGEALRLLLTEAWRAGRVDRRRLGGFWATGCHRPGEIAAAANFAVLALRRERRLAKEAAAGRGLVALQLRAAADVLEAWTASPDARAVASDGRGARGGLALGLALARRARAEEAASRPAGAPGAGLLQYQVGAAKRARPGRLVSGDTHLVKEVGPCLAVVLSDGMGAGGKAARESQAAVSLFESLLDAGMGVRAAVRAVNAALLLRARDESFATLDAFVLDRRSGRGSFLKVGGAPSYVVQGGRVTSLAGGGVPLGVLEEVRAEAGGVVLAPGDLVVLVSDGVWEGRAGGDGPDWIQGFLAAGCDLPAGDLAERLVAAAAEGREGGPDARPPVSRLHDDLTAIVVRVLARAPV